MNIRTTFLAEICVIIINLCKEQPDAIFPAQAKFFVKIKICAYTEAQA